MLVMVSGPIKGLNTVADVHGLVRAVFVYFVCTKCREFAALTSDFSLIFAMFHFHKKRFMFTDLIPFYFTYFFRNEMSRDVTH